MRFTLHHPGPLHRSFVARTLALALALICLVAGATLADDETATYRVRFDATWSAGTHPGAFPAGAHFTRLIGASHSAAVSFWAPGELASPGLEKVAEEGTTATLQAQIEQAIAAGTATQVISSSGVSPSPGSVELEVTLTREQPLLTLASMVAPSPDWFVGVHDLSLRPAGEWLDSATVDLLVYDAGTDSGASFNAPDQDSAPAAPVEVLSKTPFASSLPVGKLTLTRVAAAAADELLLGDRFKVTANFVTKDDTVGEGHPNLLTSDTGTFWFFDPTNVEIVIKVLDGCSFNGRYWVFAGGLTDVEVELRVEDTESDLVKVYRNEQGTPFAPIQDTDAFASCPPG